MNGSKLIGKKVHIKSEESFHDGGWGRVVDFDGEYYHVAMYDGNIDVCIFSRDELKIEKTAKSAR